MWFHINTIIEKDDDVDRQDAAMRKVGTSFDVIYGYRDVDVIDEMAVDGVNVHKDYCFGDKEFNILDDGVHNAHKIVDKVYIVNMHRDIDKVVEKVAKGVNVQG